ncbi:hypothetical protein D3C72_1736030 [compost metagenome]
MTSTGTLAFFNVRWMGWSSAWFVFEMKTDDILSKVSLPSGFGYTIFFDWAAGFRHSWSPCEWCRVHGALPRKINWSMPVIRLPRYKPFDSHGLTLRATCSSSCSQDFSKATG